VKAEDGDGLAAREVGHVERVRAERAAFGFDVDEFLQGACGQAVADLDGHVGDSLWFQNPQVCLIRNISAGRSLRTHTGTHGGHGVPTLRQCTNS
jgi:hypothetical protein